MANSLLENLSAAAALSGSDLFYVKQGGARGLKATGTQLLTLVGTTYVPLAGGTMTGALTLPAGSQGSPTLDFTGSGIFKNYANTLSISAGGAERLLVTADAVHSTAPLLSVYPDSSALAFGAASDIKLYRDAAATLAQRNGTTQQISRIYNTYTDASNYERLTLTGVAGTSVNITAETLGTGGDNLDIVLTPAGTGRVVIGNVGIYPSSGLVQVAQVDSSIYGSSLQLKAYTSEDVIFYEGSTVIGRFLAGGGLQLSERTAPSAPATNSVRIYAEDNGAGKTRLMALFATGSAVQIAVEP